LATCGEDGPHAANLLYVRDGFALIWVSDPGSRHSLEIAHNPRVAATIAPDCFEIADIHGMQISGRAHAITDACHRANARRLLEARYPYAKRLLDGRSGSRELHASMAFYRLEPTRMVLIDNGRGFGHKETLDLDLPADNPDEQPSRPCGGLRHEIGKSRFRV
jgi:uncharacterized protein YhbP (UPF0306 family)